MHRLSMSVFYCRTLDERNLSTKLPAAIKQDNMQMTIPFLAVGVLLLLLLLLQYYTAAAATTTTTALLLLLYTFVHPSHEH